MTLLEVLVPILLIASAILFALWRRSQRLLQLVRDEQFKLERKREQDRLRAQVLEERLVALGQAVLEAVIIVDRDLRVIYASPGAQAIFRMRHDVFDVSLIAATRSNEIDQLARDALAADAPALEDSDDLDQLVRVNDQTFRARAAGFAQGVVLALSDVSELQRLGRARRDFVANISHELRTPLTSIRLLLDGLLAGGQHTEEERQRLLDKIQVEVDSLQQIAQELLDLSAIESGRVLLRLIPTHVAQIVGDTVERLMPQAAHKQQSVNVEVSPDLVALADAEQVARVMGNLLHNAIKFTQAQGEIRVRACQQEDDVLIEIADNGPGIPTEDLPRVFERFFRSDRSRASGGTGLGLAIAKHIVEAHGGRIWVESEGRAGRGAIFYFTLPASDSATGVN